jgi:hypothetical protein
MTKARDLAGFASSSVTTTASDGLVLKGDGSSTDVVIKNGANATVATVADGTTNLAVVGAVTGALAQGAIQVGNSSGVAAPLTIGSSAQLLQSNGTTAAWATVSSSPETVTFPNFASPNNTYTSSGTWSKGSLNDDDFVWVYLVGGGGGGAYGPGSNSAAIGGLGGGAILLYGKAKYFNGGAYVIGAGGAAGTSSSPDATSRTNSTFTLTSTYGSRVYTTQTSDSGGGWLQEVNGTSVLDSVSGISVNNNLSNVFYIAGPPIGWGNDNDPGFNKYKYKWVEGSIGIGSASKSTIVDFPTNNYFGGGGGGSRDWVNLGVGYSQWAGNGSNYNSGGAAGAVPGGGGGGSTSANAAGAGGAGNVRVYHV